MRARVVDLVPVPLVDATSVTSSAPEPVAGTWRVVARYPGQHVLYLAATLKDREHAIKRLAAEALDAEEMEIAVDLSVSYRPGR